MRVLGLLMLATPALCEAQLKLNEDDSTVIQPIPSTINQESILTVSSLTIEGGGYEPGDCFQFELSSDMEEI